MKKRPKSAVKAELRRLRKSWNYDKLTDPAIGHLYLDALNKGVTVLESELIKAEKEYIEKNR